MLTPQAAQGTARIAGLGYLAIFVLAILANFVALEPLGASGDIAATAAGIATNETTFRTAVAAFILVLIADVVVGWALFVVLRPADVSLSLLVLLFRLVYTISHVGVVLGLVSALRFATEADMGAIMGPHAAALAYQFFTGHGLSFAITLIFFGVHLLLLGMLINRAGYIPKAIGWLLLLAGVAYLVDGFGRILFGSYGPNADLMTILILVPALVGEGSLMGWLIVRGIDTRRYVSAHGNASSE